MVENLNSGLHLHFQVPEDSNSVRHYRETGEPTGLSTDLGYNDVGRNVTPLDLSHSYHIQDIEGGRDNHISLGNAETAGGNDNDDGTENEIPPLHCEPNLGILTRGGENSEVHVRCFSPLRENTKTDDTNQSRKSKKVESERDECATMGDTYCPNSGTIKTLQASFGKLFRIGTMGSVTRRNELCRLVLPHPGPAQESGTTFGDHETMYIMSDDGKDDDSLQGCSDSFMVIDTFVSEQDRRRIALTFGYDLPYDSRDPKELIEVTNYMECVAEFGFNHIIVIGEVDYGMIFIDCYGRLFHWEGMCQRLWPYESDDGLPWFVGDYGSIYKFKS